MTQHVGVVDEEQAAYDARWQAYPWWWRANCNSTYSLALDVLRSAKREERGYQVDRLRSARDVIGVLLEWLAAEVRELGEDEP